LELFRGRNLRRNSCGVKANGARFAALDRGRAGALCFIGSRANRPPARHHGPDHLSRRRSRRLARSAHRDAGLFRALRASRRRQSDQTLRRVRPAVCLLDCEDPDELLRRIPRHAATMRISPSWSSASATR
jgi:hypothetical protein